MRASRHWGIPACGCRSDGSSSISGRPIPETELARLRLRVRKRVALAPMTLCGSTSTARGRFTPASTLRGLTVCSARAFGASGCRRWARFAAAWSPAWPSATRPAGPASGRRGRSSPRVSTMPVSGARTLAVNSAPMPTMAQATGETCPHRARSDSAGRQIPPPTMLPATAAARTVRRDIPQRRTTGRGGNARRKS